ncbi:GGDEF domain-containing protein [Cellulomonas sp. IC4_254]|uniref:GGDEF domain-containing protein n=1 Tax=Cellulomonas sp. IC4_254 TaxID=2714040 RepID=UPI00141FAB63|nr:GGDEF domain-containing protein [Cellulomonas sp. IC4_254]NHT19714.1 GGDEF domain-containing protein [Cellulomonas sp. IC4_254]
MPTVEQTPHGDPRPQLAVAFLVVSVLTAVGGLTPLDPQAPTGRWAIAAAAYAVLAVLAVTLPAHPTSTQAVLVAGVVVAGGVLASCRATEGVVVLALGVVLAGQVAASVLDTRRAAVVVAAAAATLALGAWLAVAPVHATTVVSMATLGVLSCVLLGWQGRRLRAAGGTDHLTGALTRGPFYERLEAAVARARRRGQPLAVVALDIDDFRRVNDTHGHLGADDLMADLVDRWRAELDRAGFVGRLGGDEFVAVLPGHDETAARRWAALACAWNPLPCSAGVAVLAPGDAVRDLLVRADADLWADKHDRKAGAPA